MVTIGEGLLAAGSSLGKAISARRAAKRDKEAWKKFGEFAFPDVEAPQVLEVPESLAPNEDWEVQDAINKAVAGQNEESAEMRDMLSVPGPGREYAAAMLQNQMTAEQKRQEHLMRPLQSLGNGYVGRPTEEGSWEMIKLPGEAGKLQSTDPEKDLWVQNADQTWALVQEGVPQGEYSVEWKLDPEVDPKTGGIREEKIAVWTYPDGRIVKEPQGEYRLASQQRSGGPLKALPYNPNMDPRSNVAAQSSVALRNLNEEYAQTKDIITRMKGIEYTFKPEYLTAFGKLKQGVFAMRDFLNIPVKHLGKLTPAERKWYGEASEFTRKVNDNVNRYIKFITGAQMSEAEATRLMKAVANIGDTPTEFFAKLQGGMAQLEIFAMEKEMLLREAIHALDGMGISDPDTYKSLLQTETERIESEMRIKVEDFYGTWWVDPERGYGDPSNTGEFGYTDQDGGWSGGPALVTGD